MVHPTSLQSELVSLPDVEAPPTVRVPVLGRAESREQLPSWVIAVFQEGHAVPIKLTSNGDIAWCNQTGSGVVVSVRNQWWIEVWAVLARQVSFNKARKLMHRLSQRYAGVQFHLRQDTLLLRLSPPS